MHRTKLLPISVGILLSGCLQSTTQMTALTQAQSVCKADGSSGKIAHIAQSVGVPREQASQACDSARNYTCTRAVFSPDVRDGHSTVQECAEAGVLGSPCIDIESQEFDTRAAIQAAALDPLTTGTYNHSEYTCYNLAITANQSFPASALQHPSLSEALVAAHKRCNEIAAALPSGK